MGTNDRDWALGRVRAVIARYSVFERETRTGRAVRRVRESPYSKPVLFLFIAMGLSALLSPYFLTWRNLRSILITASPLIIITVGQAAVVLTGMIDLGVESVLASSGVIIATLDILKDAPIALAVVVTLLYGLAVGLVNGLLVTKARIPSFVATLGMYWGLRGFGMVMSGGYPISPTSVSPTKPLRFSGLTSNVLGVPWMVLLALFIVAVFHLYFTLFKRGKDVYATGGNEIAARNCGVDVDAIKLFVFMVSGLLAAVAGIVMTAWVNQAYAWTAQGFSLQAVAAVVLGGIPFVGGYGTIIGAAVGAIIIAMISDVMVLLGVSPLYTYIVVAAVLLLAGLQIEKRDVVK